MKSVLHIVNIYFTIPYFIGNQIDYFDGEGYRVHIICSPSEELKKYAKVHPFKYKEISILRKISIVDDLKATYNVYRYIKKNNIDIVVGHTPKGAIIAMLASFMARVPKRLYFRHGLVYETAVGFKRKLLKSIDKLAAFFSTKIICVSPSIAEKSNEDKLNSVNKQVILNRGTCNGINIDKFSLKNLDAEKRDAYFRKYNIPNDAYVIGFVGRLVKDKGIYELVNAFRQFKQENSNVKLLLVGMFEERDRLSNDVINYINNDEDIIYTDYVNYDDIQYYYSLMSVFVLPSYREGFPTSTLEASAMNKPIITTRATGCIDSIIEDKTGVFVEHCSESLCNAFKFFYEHKDKLVEYGNNGRLFVEKNFSQIRVWEEIKKLYQ